MDQTAIEPPPAEPPLGLRRMQRDPLTFGLERYELYGPVFTVRAFHRPIVFLLGPEANHFVTVAAATGHRLEIATVPNLTPEGGLPMVLEPR